MAERSIAAVLKCNRFRGVYSPPISTKREHRSPKSSAETPDFRQKAVNFGHYAKPRERLAISTKAPPICGNSQIFLQIVSGGKFAGKTQYFQWKVGREDEGARLENVKRQKRSGVRIPYLPPSATRLNSRPDELFFCSEFSAIEAIISLLSIFIFSSQPVL